MDVAQKYNLTINRSKCTFRKDTVSVLGYQIGDGTLKPDPNRLTALLDMPSPQNLKAQQRILGMFAH